MCPLLAISLSLVLLNFSPYAIGKDAKVIKWGDITLVDETQLKFPNDYSADFEEDTQKKAEFGDAYDERIEPLPSFDLWQNGQRIGPTELPIVTRKKSFWSTSLGTTREGFWWQTTEKWSSTAPQWEKGGKGAAEEGDNDVGGQDERSSTVPTTTAQKKASAGSATAAGTISTTNWPIELSQTIPSSQTMPPAATTETSRSTPSTEARVWSRSWGVGPDGKMELRIWKSGKGERVEQKMLSGEERRRLKQNQRNGGRGEAIEATTKMAKAPPKIGNRQKGGVASKCNVLDATKDGRPSEDNDGFCKLASPGIPADNSCTCTYAVAGRDAKGCAVGFIYTCKRERR